MKFLVKLFLKILIIQCDNLNECLYKHFAFVPLYEKYDLRMYYHN